MNKIAIREGKGHILDLLQVDLLFTTGKSWVQRLLVDTAIANITAVSLNVWLIKLVKEQSLIFAFSYLERNS